MYLNNLAPGIPARAEAPTARGLHLLPPTPHSAVVCWPCLNPRFSEVWPALHFCASCVGNLWDPWDPAPDKSAGVWGLGPHPGCFVNQGPHRKWGGFQTGWSQEVFVAEAQLWGTLGGWCGTQAGGGRSVTTLDLRNKGREQSGPAKKGPEREAPYAEQRPPAGPLL